MWVATRRSDRAFSPQEDKVEHRHWQFDQGFPIFPGNERSHGAQMMLGPGLLASL
jgi:hypothetical protein